MKKQYTRQLQALQEAVTLSLENKYTLSLSFFLFLTGIFSGVFLELTMAAEDKEGVLHDLQQYLSAAGDAMDYPNPFAASVSSNLFLLFLLLLAGFSVAGFPAAFLILLYKGISLGFSAGLLLENQMENGAFLILSSLVPQNLALIPAFILSASGVLNYSFSRLKGKKQPNRKSRDLSPGSLVVLILFSALLAVIGCGTEAILYPIVLSS